MLNEISFGSYFVCEHSLPLGLRFDSKLVVGVWWGLAGSSSNFLMAFWLESIYASILIFIVITLDKQ